nr:hypothetical protein [Deltaproteobacteria bacterium]
MLGLAVGIGGGAAVTGVGTWMAVRHDGRAWDGNWGLYVAAAGAGMMLGGLLTAVLPSYLHGAGRHAGDALPTSRSPSAGPASTRRSTSSPTRRAAAAHVEVWLSPRARAAMVVGAGVLYGVRDDSTTNSAWAGIFGLGGRS